MDPIPSLVPTGIAVDVEPVRLRGADGPLAGIEARPAGLDPETAILFVHENRGLVPYMWEVVEALASLGHRVVAPDLLSRLGGTDAAGADITTRRIPVEAHLADLTAVADALATTVGRWAVVGFCFGAEMGWHLVCERDPTTAVLLYGIGRGAEESAGIRCPVYAVYAEDDERVNSTLDPTLAGLRRGSSDYVVESYPRTRHAFHDHHRPDRFHPDAAVEVWRRITWFLDRNLGEAGNPG